MKTFDKVPVMDRECFEREIRHAQKFGVWVQVNSAFQICLDITKEQAREIAEAGFGVSDVVWGQRCSVTGRLELSITSQWQDSLRAAEAQ